ncbi:hypothetical protein ACFZCY_38530 [Streptomyces sp. NPDC007983]|uniref:hypothetical protein n=1 Tax=Streptomyces sp. NPDC007983 TaxID=3364800 RepID=UPI0036F0E54D
MSTELDNLWPLLFPAIGQTLQMVAAVMLIVVTITHDLDVETQPARLPTDHRQRAAP